MARNGGTCLYKEARLNIEPAFPGSTVSITLPASSNSTFGLQTRAKRTIIDDVYNKKDDDSFSRRHLANDGSMFFRRHGRYPRMFLWRLLDGRKTLELQATDMEHEYNDKYEANITLMLHFTSPIRPFCIGFAEPEDRDALTVFAITSNNELYTITIPRDFFMKPEASELDIGDWCKRNHPTLFSTNVPYRLVAISVDELLVTLGNGGVLRLERENKDDALWNETIFQHNNWSLTLRGVLPWKGQPTIRFENTDLALSSAAAVTFSPDRKHIITVCLDHTLRIFNVESGKMTRQQDLMDNTDGAHDRNQSNIIEPSQSTLLQIVNTSAPPGAEYYIAVYSPLRHEFKFWGIRDADDGGEQGIFDVQPEFSFLPPIDDLMNTTVWTLEEFFIIPRVSTWTDTRLWVRARSGPSSKVYSITFDPSEASGRLSQSWKNDWTTVDSGPLTIESLRNHPANPGEQEWDSSDLYENGLAEKWLDFLFVPGRFTIATLETALSIMRRDLEADHLTAALTAGLKDRLCATIAASAAKARRIPLGPETYDQAISEQWLAYFGIVQDLHKRRGEYISLSYDFADDVPWLVLSDYLSAIRKCSDLETIALNPSLVNGTPSDYSFLHKALQKPEPESRNISRLLNAAALFRRRFSSSFQQELKQQIQMDVLRSQPVTVVDRMEEMEANCELSSLVKDEDLSILVQDLGLQIRSLSTDVFVKALSTLQFHGEGKQPQQSQHKKQVARYGLSALLGISLETLETNYNTLLDLLVVILFMQYESELSDHFDASQVFVLLVDEFKDWYVLNWLATTVWSYQTPTGPSSTILMKSLDETLQTKRRFPMIQTVLEGMYGDDAFDFSIPNGLKVNFLTYWSRGWTASIFEKNTFDSAVEDVMAKLLSQKEYRLAMDFSKFLSDTNWASYLKGRLFISMGDNQQASVYFQRAAYNLGTCTETVRWTKSLILPALSSNFNIDEVDSANLLTEIERAQFSEGLPIYFSHVMSLFEKAKAYSFVADYARLGLRSMMGSRDQTLKSELLQRLFTALIQTSRFEDAYTALIGQPNAALYVFLYP